MKGSQRLWFGTACIILIIGVRMIIYGIINESPGYVTVPVVTYIVSIVVFVLSIKNDDDDPGIWKWLFIPHYLFILIEFIFKDRGLLARINKWADDKLTLKND